MSKRAIYRDRDKRIYELFQAGNGYKLLATEFEITASGIKQALNRYRKANNLSKGRKCKHALAASTVLEQ